MATKPAPAPLIKDIKALKELLLWCKAEGVQSIEAAGVKATFSVYAMAAQGGPDLTIAPPDTRTPEQRKLDQAREDEEILMWSVK